jgi:hypothetical protein
LKKHSTAQDKRLHFAGGDPLLPPKHPCQIGHW